jgi:molecular chaperone GrpE
MAHNESTPHNDEAKAEEAAGCAAPSAGQHFLDDAEGLSNSIEHLFRRVMGEEPRAADFGEMRTIQAMLKDLVRRAAASAPEGAPADAGPKVAELTAEISKLKDQALRAKADFLNYQSRAGKDLDRAEEQALRKFVLELLPILDNLDLANADAKSANFDPQRVKEALDLTGQSVKQVLAVRGLERVQTVGKHFDPTQHEAVFKRPPNPEAGEKTNTVGEECRAGYLWKGLILRPAQVVVIEAKK